MVHHAHYLACRLSLAAVKIESKALDVKIRGKKVVRWIILAWPLDIYLWQPLRGSCHSLTCKRSYDVQKVEFNHRQETLLVDSG